MTRLTKDDKYKIIKKHDFRVLDTDGLTGIRYEISKVDAEDNVTLTRLDIVDSNSEAGHDVYMGTITGTYNLKVRNLYIFQNKKGYYFSIKESIHPELSVVLERDMDFCKKLNVGFFKTSKDFSSTPVKEKAETNTCESKPSPVKSKEEPVKKDCKCPLKKVRKSFVEFFKKLFSKQK